MTLEEIEAMDKGCISSNVAAAYWDVRRMP